MKKLWLVQVAVFAISASAMASLDRKPTADALDPKTGELANLKEYKSSAVQCSLKQKILSSDKKVANGKKLKGSKAE